ncbi:MAG: hypothetical protein HZA78_07365 [Candidatus Schekmanbacteria bacterium]|nr:hypothetical protein [Candidatus Schekmanbacteria bacterium]
MRRKKLSEQEIDEIVAAQAANGTAWENWEEVNPIKSVSVELSEKAIGRLKTIARLKGEKGIDALLKKWIDERLIYEQQIISETRKMAK